MSLVSCILVATGTSVMGASMILQGGRQQCWIDATSLRFVLMSGSQCILSAPHPFTDTCEVGCGTTACAITAPVNAVTQGLL